MSGPRRFRDLAVWKKAIELSVLVYELTAELPKTEKYGLVTQMRRSAVSVASNVAEGSGRGSDRVFRVFVGIALGSNFELQTQLVILRRLQMGDAKHVEAVEALCVEVARMLHGLRQTLSRELKIAAREQTTAKPERVLA